MVKHSPAPTPSRAVYGFAFHLLSLGLLLTYFAWALVPDAVFEALGVDFLPQKYWAVAVPIYLSVAFLLFVFVVYPSLGLIQTFPWDDVRNVTDEFARYDGNKGVKEGGIPLISDVHPKEVYNKKK